ncbi:MAG: radical SAM family heme chaperone HemW [Termitinemataceae bacterium]|nr:MAG: radical SAM family heme chaperone HemW [Termitinemataceae bacterium]
MTASLYIHIPFCLKKCDYCDFYSIPIHDTENNIDAYLLQLNHTIQQQIKHFCITYIPTIYIGGGSPSSLGAKKLEVFLQKLQTVLPNAPNEFTIETNPEFTNADFLSACNNNGVSRISMGVQTFNESSRTSVGRLGNSFLLHERLALLSKKYSQNFSVDLISGLPFQTEKIVCDDIKSVLQYKPAHISLYDLTIEKNTKLYKNVNTGKIFLPSPEESETIWLSGRDFLEQYGYEQYEVSNFCFDQTKRSLHNIRYWRMENWIGIGASASGTIINDTNGTGQRITFAQDVKKFIKSAQPTIEQLDKTNLLKDSLLMGFRYLEGLDDQLFKMRFGKNVFDLIPQTLQTYQKKGYIQSDKIALTKTGLLFLNTFLRSCFSELDIPSPLR